MSIFDSVGYFDLELILVCPFLLLGMTMVLHLSCRLVIRWQSLLLVRTYVWFGRLISAMLRTLGRWVIQKQQLNMCLHFPRGLRGCYRIYLTRCILCQLECLALRYPAITNGPLWLVRASRSHDFRTAPWLLYTAVIFAMPLPSFMYTIVKLNTVGIVTW